MPVTRNFTFTGLRQQRVSRQTGTTVSVYDGDAAGMDTDWGRWQTVCETHGRIAAWDTISAAKIFASSPIDWCEDCAEAHDENTTDQEGSHA